MRLRLLSSCVLRNGHHSCVDLCNGIFSVSHIFQGTSPVISANQLSLTGSQFSCRENIVIPPFVHSHYLRKRPLGQHELPLHLWACCLREKRTTSLVGSFQNKNTFTSTPFYAFTNKIITSCRYQHEADLQGPYGKEVLRFFSKINKHLLPFCPEQKNKYKQIRLH